MTGKVKRVLIACYGGGHVQSLIPVVHALQEIPEIELVVLGFTTARMAFERVGIDALGYDSLLEESDEEWVDLVKPYLPEETHPDISQLETLAYYAIGLRDLVLSYGRESALKLFSENGRRAFFPKNTFTLFLKKIAPDLVVTSTSPRSELALQHAAADLKIDALAISDLFLQHESEYICASSYARNVTVMADYVAESLKAKGYTGNLYVTGNPAFDDLSLINVKDGGNLRRRLGIAEQERLILWVCPSAPTSIIGKDFVQPAVMLAHLEAFCEKQTNTRYLVRQHPSKPVLDRPLSSTSHGLLCPPLVAIEDCLSAADIVLLETSTVGLQAALLGLPVVTIGAGDYPPYAQLGLSVDVPNLGSVEEALLRAKKPRLDLLSYPALDCSGARVVEVICGLLGIMNSGVEV